MYEIQSFDDRKVGSRASVYQRNVSLLTLVKEDAKLRYQSYWEIRLSVLEARSSGSSN